MALNCTRHQMLYSRREAAEYLGIAEQTLATWACTKRYDIPYIKIGRLVKYRATDLDAFIERQSFGGETLQ